MATAANDQKFSDSPTPLRRLRWKYVLTDGAMHLGALYAPLCFSWSGIALCFALLWVLGTIGITAGWHRLLTHRSYKTSKPIEWLIGIIGCLNLQGGPIEWVGTHRLHHAHTETELDPHSPKHGLFWAHCGWLCVPLAFRASDYARDLLRDPVMVWIDRLHLLFPALFMAILYFAGEWVSVGTGISWLVWGGCVRAVLIFHSTWLVNSATHKWGYRNFETNDDSTNLWWVAFLALGEGWHNNHHAQQRSAAHGMFHGEFDPTYQTIRLMRAVGLAWDVIEPDLGACRVRRKRESDSDQGRAEPKVGESPP